ncbi:MAG: response regulator [Verrucomicrobia bacterium]|nr:response regulator [Verrucomicrobiota bacterium]
MNRLSNYLVALVEDNRDDAFLIQRSLRQAGLSRPVIVFEDGDTIVQYLSGEGMYADRDRYPLPDLLLLDLKLPRRDGFEVLRWLREQPGLCRLVVAVLTGSRQHADVQRAYELGANSYLVKPVGLQAVTTLGESLCRYWATVNEGPLLS